MPKYSVHIEHYSVGGSEVFIKKDGEGYANIGGSVRKAEIAQEIVDLLNRASPGKEGGQEVERDFPAEFEAWWETYRHKNREPADYSVKKQIAFDAFYFAGCPQPASTALVERLQQLHAEQHRILGEMLLDKSEEGQAKANWQGGKVNGIAAALSASQSTSMEK